jgi:transposase
MNRKAYPTDLTDQEWAILEPLVPPPKAGGRPSTWPRREFLNAVFYVLRSGAAWRLLPHDVPPWQTVYHYVRLWRLDGTWERLHTALREQTRVQAGRNRQPSAAILDSQSVKTTEKGGCAVWMDTKRCVGASATSSLTPRGVFSKSWSMRRTSTIAKGAAW